MQAAGRLPTRQDPSVPLSGITDLCSHARSVQSHDPDALYDALIWQPLLNGSLQPVASSDMFRSAMLTPCVVEFMKTQPGEVHSAARLLKLWTSGLMKHHKLPADIKPVGLVAETLAAVAGETLGFPWSRSSFFRVFQECLRCLVKLAESNVSAMVKLYPATKFYRFSSNGSRVAVSHFWQHGSQRRWHGVLLHPVDPTENLLGQACWDQSLLALAAEARALLQCMEASSSFEQLMRSSSLGVAYHNQVNRLEQLRAAGRV